MIDMRFFKDERELELSSEAELELPLSPNSFVQGDEIDTWAFDGAQGLWTLEGRATVDRSKSSLNPRPGAVIYYDSEMYDSGLLGWDYNLGRVATFSTTVGTNELADPNFSLLVANTLNWVQAD